MCRAVALLLALGSLFFAAGCRNCDLVEAELRTRDNDLRDVRADLARAECQNEALVRELQAVRQGTTSNLSPEQASQTYTLKQITLGRQTGGYDDDGCPGDEALQVVLEPRDCDGHVIKAPGTLHVEALEISTEGLKAPLSTWDVTSDQLRRSWRSGFWSTGYFLVLPWKNWPTSERLRVVARFMLSDGRAFEADKDVAVRLTPVARRKMPAAIPPPPPPDPVIPSPEVPLSSSGKVEQASVSSKAWWLPPPAIPTEQPAITWRPKAPPSLTDFVRLARPAPLAHEPGEE
jgi:hypothetical protein